MSSVSEPYLTRPTSQLDLEARREAEKQTVEGVDPNAVDRQYAVEGNDTSAYVGVSPEYMTYADDTHKPMSGDGLEDEVAAEMLGGFAYGETPTTEGVQTHGTGSNVPSVFVGTSGEAVTAAVVDREKVQAEIDKLEVGQPLTKTTEEMGAVSDSTVESGEAAPAPIESAKPVTPAAPVA